MQWNNTGYTVSKAFGNTPATDVEKMSLVDNSGAIVAEFVQTAAGVTTFSAGGVKVYRALFTQTGTANPTINELENTAQFGSWIRGNVGFYDLHLSPAIPLSKIFISGWLPAIGGPVIEGIISGGGSGITAYWSLWADDDPVTVLELKFMDAAGDGVEYSSFTSDYFCLPEILVYP